MVCPKCNKEIDHVITASYHFESVYFKEGSKEIYHETWSHVGDGDVESAHCPECDEDIWEEIN